MRALFAAGVLAAAALTPAVAQTPPASPFELFRRVCIDTNADMARTVATPELRGWLNMPFPMQPHIENGRITAKELRVKAEGRDKVIVVMAARGEVTARDGRKIPFVNCTVAFKPGDLAPAQARVRAWLGFEPMALPKGVIGFHFTEKGGVRTPLRVAKLSEMPAQPAGVRVGAVDLKFEKGSLILSYTLPRL